MTVSAAHADAFFNEVLDGGFVWMVRDADGIPAPQVGDGARAMPFWSKRSRALKVISTVAAYDSFETQEIPLAEWRSRWLPGLQRDGLSVGLNWSGERATGYDYSPQDVERILAARDSA